MTAPVVPDDLLTRPHSPPARPVSFVSPVTRNAVSEMSLDLVLVCASAVGAHLLRFGGTFPPPSPVALYGLPAVGLLKMAVFYQFQLYGGLWAHAGTPEAVRLVKASTVASVCVLPGLIALPSVPPVPIALLVLDWMLTTLAVGAWRFAHRARRHYRRPPTADRRRVLIYGADADGVFALRYLRHLLPDTGAVVGFLDPEHGGTHMKGLPIVESPSALDVDEVVVPVPLSSSAVSEERTYNRIAATCAEQNLSCRRFIIGLRSTPHAAPSGGATNCPVPE